ncbi:hypothetical protein ACS0VJ_06330 [Corynebacterium macclintockiae]|uniref:hypothetical protein n=1 Tax=Corynebacterium macclintockiae TaxID=2913501 RepID=UPI003EBB8932
MSDSNPYGQPGPNPGGQNSYSQQPNQPQPQSQFGQPNQYGQPGQPGHPGPAAKQGLQSLAWNQLAAGVAGIGALLVLLFSFFKWVGIKITYFDEKYTYGVNGWGVFSTNDDGEKEDLAAEFGNTGLGVLFMLVTLGLLIAAAVLLWLKIQPRVAVYLGIAGGVVHLSWAIWTIVDFNGPYKEFKEWVEPSTSTDRDYITVDGGPKFAVFLAIIIALAIIVLGVLAIVKFGQQLNVPGNNQPNQFGQPQNQPNQQLQFDQPQNQPNQQLQFDQPQNQPNQQGQFGQPGNQNPFNQPGQ